MSLLILAVLALTAATSRGDVVRALLFFSPSCPHCHDVMERHLPPLLAKHGEGLRIVAVNVQTPDGAALYDAVARHFALRPDQQGVPALVVGGRLLMGSGEIPAELPGIVKAGLAAGGIDWPDIAGVRSFLVANALLEPEAPPVALPEPETPPVAAPASAPPTRPSAQGSEPPRSEPPVGRDDAAGASRAGTDREPAEAAPPVSGSAPDASGGLVVVAPAGGDDATVWRKFGRDPIGN
ncbi:MAG TPA: DsbA family protein, partial [Longimicrobiales bacterium]|nr:DsbA family protein [Longimicrobiales bacterium]